MTEEQFQKDVLDVLKDEKAKLILLKKQSDPMTKLVLLRLKGKTTLRTIEDLIYTTFDMEHLEKYLLQLKTILLQLSQHSKLFTRHMMYEDFKQMDWDVGSLRQLQRVLDPNGHLYIGSNVENKILSILDYLYDGTSLHFKMKKNNNKNNMLCYKNDVRIIIKQKEEEAELYDVVHAEIQLHKKKIYIYIYMYIQKSKQEHTRISYIFTFV